MTLLVSTFHQLIIYQIWGNLCAFSSQFIYNGADLADGVEPFFEKEHCLVRIRFIHLSTGYKGEAA